MLACVLLLSLGLAVVGLTATSLPLLFIGVALFIGVSMASGRIERRHR